MDKDSESLGRGLKQHSLKETQLLNQTFVDLSKEADDKKMNELEQDLTDKTQQIQHLQQRIRRMSTVPTAGQQPPDSEQVRALQAMVDRLRSESTLSSQRIVGLEGEL